MPINLKEAYEEFHALKTENEQRNANYFYTRQAIKGNFRWPRGWPRHIERRTYNLCKRITRQHATYLMGRGYQFNINRPNTLEYRESAERTEKILKQLHILSRAEVQDVMGALTGSQLGRTIFKVYTKGKKDSGRKHACFSYCQPDYFYGVPSGDNHVSDYSVVYYSYPLDINEAVRLHGPGDYRPEGDSDVTQRYNTLIDNDMSNSQLRKRRIPVFEAWTKDDYALVVGGVTKFNGENPYKWKDTQEGFIPYVVIENSRNAGETLGESDISEARELNEFYNQLYSLHAHSVQRYLRPTLVWEGAPQNYGQILAQVLEGGGAIPARLGSKLYFLVHDRPNPAVQELLQLTRAGLLETSGMSEMALQGTVQGSVNTGPALQAQFQPVLSAVEAKRTEWTWGIKQRSAMLLELQEQIGDSGALGEAVINQDRYNKSQNAGDGELVRLSGKDIQGLREVEILWPEILPQDNIAQARLEMEKAAQDMQSLYTTLEKLGEPYPADEIARMRMENQDPALKGQKVAEQLRAQTPLIKAQMDQQTQMAQQETDALANLASMQGEDAQAAQPLANDLGSRIREIAASSQARLDMDSEEEPFIAAAEY